MAKGAYIGALKLEYEPIFANNSWPQIIKACQKNEVPDTWVIGDQKDMTINGTDYTIDIIGINHDEYSDGSGKAPLTFQLHDCYGTTYRMNSTKSNTNGWDYSEMRTTHLPAILALMPNEVQEGIKEVNKLTSRGYTDTTVTSIADKLFLLSMMEMFGATTSNSSGEGALGEGTQYAYYSAGNSKIKKLDGTAQLWWSRSPRITATNGYCAVSTSGEASFYNNSQYARGVSFAFCFGGTSQINNTFGGSDIARKIKKGYIGVENLARKIKKAYIGIGGVARPCWSGGELAYYGTITGLRSSVYGAAATTVGDYALFGGGRPSSGSSAYVTAYDKSLARSTPDSLEKATYYLAATTVGNRALFGGGETSVTVTAYDSALTKSKAADLNTQVGSCTGNAATTIGGYALFAGGYYDRWDAAVTSYTESLTKGTPTVLSVGRNGLAATTVGNYALFAGGAASSVKDTVDAYNTSLTRSTPTVLSLLRSSLAATRIGNYALFGGGNCGGSVDTVDAYDSSLTRSTPTVLQTKRKELAATTVGDFALFAGGLGSNTNTRYKVVDMYDASLTRTTMTNLSNEKGRLAATSVGDYALFAGGWTGNVTNSVDAYVVA